jgi:uncharacterized membrane protein (DUF2068 family)
LKGEKKLLLATVLLLAGGMLNLLQSTGLWQRQHFFVASLATVSGVCLLVIALFNYISSKTHVIWGVLAFLYSTIGYIAIGLAEIDHPFLLSLATIALLLGTMGGAIILTQK